MCCCSSWSLDNLRSLGFAIFWHRYKTYKSILTKKRKLRVLQVGEAVGEITSAKNKKDIKKFIILLMFTFVKVMPISLCSMTHQHALASWFKFHTWKAKSTRIFPKINLFWKVSNIYGISEKANLKKTNIAMICQKH